MDSTVNVDPSEFHDEDDHLTDDLGNFPVTPEELKELRDQLKELFPEDFDYLSDKYVESVASKPYSKDTSVRRPLEYTLSKLKAVMEWRQSAGAPKGETLVKIATGDATAISDNPDLGDKATALVTSLNNNSLYWHGFTKDGHPILWVRTNRKPWFPDVQADLDALLVLADAGVRAMPPSVTSFCVFADSTSPPPPSPNFMIGMLQALVKGYPDRLHLLMSAPISSIIQFVMNLLLPLMPGRLSSKVFLSDEDGMRSKLEEILMHGKDDIPHFFGGPSNHDELFPEESKCPNRGGALKFDYFGMVERLQAQKEEWMAMDAKREKEEADA